MAANMKKLNQILKDATAKVDELYFHLYIDGGDAPIYRERVYCYELYHQMRLLWPLMSEYVLNGEVDKAAHPLLRELDADGVKPDLLIHTPGYMSGNHAIIEIKHINAKRRDILKDLHTLKKFMDRVNYERGIYLFYGDLASDKVQSKVNDAAKIKEIDITKIELWHHREVGNPAKQLQ